MTVIAPYAVSEVRASQTSGPSASLSATFQALVGGGYTRTRTAFGACLHETSTGSPPQTTKLSAGTVTVRGTAGKLLEISPQTTLGSPSYPVGRAEADLWAPGDEVTLAAPGDTFPAFSVKLRAPTRVVVSAPVLTGPATRTPVSTTTDLSVAWTGGGAGVLTLSFGLANSTDSVICSFPAAAGAGIVPAAALAKLRAIGVNGLMYCTSESVDERMVGQQTLATHVQTECVEQTKGGAFMQGVTYQ